MTAVVVFFGWIILGTNLEGSLIFSRRKILIYKLTRNGRRVRRETGEGAGGLGENVVRTNNYR